jgi:putative adhesin
MKVLPTLSIAVAAAIAIPHSVQAWPSEERVETRSFDLSATGNVVVQNSSGDTRVIGWDSSRVELRAIKTAFSRDDISRMQAVVTNRSDNFAVRAVAPENCFNCDLSFELRVPRGAHVTADTSSGDVKIEMVSGPVRVEAASGSVSLRDDTGEAHLHAASGDISIEGSGALVDAVTSSGDIEATKLTGSVNFVASSGELKADFSRIDGAKSVRMESSSGDVSLIVPRGAGFKVEANTTSGSIDSNLRLPIHERDSGADVAAQVGDGKIAVQLSSTSGNIAINMR